ncbi:hypothetical protein A2U01_0018943, partial [Trifolium medium]|nr:hypothetical protein [Trifolium medium]
NYLNLLNQTISTVEAKDDQEVVNLETSASHSYYKPIPTTHIFQNIISATEKSNQPNSEQYIPTSEAEKIQVVEKSTASEATPSEHQSPIIFTETDIQNSDNIFAKFENFFIKFPQETIFHDFHPSHYYQPNISAKIGKLLKNHMDQNLMNQLTLQDSDQISNLPKAPPVTNPELAKICNNIILRMKHLHQLRYSFTEPYMYLDTWETLRNVINDDLNKIHNGDINELLKFQKSTREWVQEVNKEFESAQLKKKGRLSIPNNFFYESTVTNQVWRENLGLLDNEPNMHLKFSLEPKTLFVKKEFVENPEFEAFKAEVKEELSSQKKDIQELMTNQRAMAARQEDMSADLKAILTILSQK